MTGFSGFELMSRTGAKLRFTPSAKSRRAVRAARSLTSAGPPDADTARADGGTSQKPDIWETMPPSSSAQISAGSSAVAIAACTARVKRMAVGASGKFGAKKMTPAGRMARRRSSTSGVSSVPGTPTISNSPSFDSSASLPAMSVMDRTPSGEPCLLE